MILIILNVTYVQINILAFNVIICTTYLVEIVMQIKTARRQENLEMVTQRLVNLVIQIFNARFVVLHQYVFYAILVFFYQKDNVMNKITVQILENLDQEILMALDFVNVFLIPFLY